MSGESPLSRSKNSPMGEEFIFAPFSSRSSKRMVANIPSPGTHTRTVPYSCVQRTCNSARTILDEQNSQQASFQIRRDGASGKSRTCDLLVRRLRLQNPNCLIVSRLRLPTTPRTALSWATNGPQTEDPLAVVKVNART